MPASRSVRRFSSRLSTRTSGLPESPRSHGGIGMKPREAAGNGVDVAGVEPPATDQRLEAALLFDPPHLDRVLDRAAVVVRGEHIPIPVSRDPHDPQVDMWGEPAIEANLLPAHLVATLDGAVVEEREAHRLLHLVSEVAGEEDPGGVGLPELYPLGRVGIETRFEHRRDQGRLLLLRRPSSRVGLSRGGGESSSHRALDHVDDLGTGIATVDGLQRLGVTPMQAHLAEADSLERGYGLRLVDEMCVHPSPHEHGEDDSEGSLAGSLFKPARRRSDR